MIDPVSGSPAWLPVPDASGAGPAATVPLEAQPESTPPDPPPPGSPGPPLSAAEALARYLGAGAPHARTEDASAGTDVYA